MASLSIEIIVQPYNRLPLLLILQSTNNLYEHASLLALRVLQTLRIHRLALRAPEVTQSNLFWDFFLKYCK